MINDEIKKKQLVKGKNIKTKKKLFQFVESIEHMIIYDKTFHEMYECIIALLVKAWRVRVRKHLKWSSCLFHVILLLFSIFFVILRFLLAYYYYYYLKCLAY